MANSNLYGKTSFNVPDSVINHIKGALHRYGNVNGSQRAINLLNSRKVSYSLAKKIKNFFDNFVSDRGSVATFELYGGKPMHNWLNTALGGSRNAQLRTKTVKSNAGMDNQFIKNHEKSHIKASRVDRKLVSLPKMKRMELFESILMDDSERMSAICILFNGEGKFLLVKRKDGDSWMPNKWALVGGGVDEDEAIEDAVIREIKEETNLEANGVMYMFNTLEDNSKVYVFMGKCDDPDKIILDENEHTEYAWVTIQECDNYDTVPLIKEYVIKALETFKKEKPTV